MAIINDAGKLNQKCTFYTIEEKETPRGTVKKSEVEKFTCWCTIRQARISEIQASIGTEHIAKNTLIIRHRQREQIQNDWTVKFKGKMYDIISVVPDYETQMFDMIVIQDRY